MKQVFVLFLIFPSLQAADIEMNVARKYSSEQFKIFIAMQIAAKFFFQVINEKNAAFAQEAENDHKQYGGSERMPSEYACTDTRDIGLSFPKRKFYLTEGLLFDAKQLSFVCSLGTWQFADNGSFIHKCFKGNCKKCRCVAVRSCNHTCKYNYSKLDPWQDIFKHMMKTEPYNEVDGLQKVVEVNGFPVPAPVAIWCYSYESPAPSPSVLREYSYEEQKESRLQKISELAVLHDYRWHDSEPDIFEAPCVSRTRSLSDGLTRSLNGLMRRLSISGVRQEVPELITDPEPIMPEQAKVIWAAMLESKQKLDADAQKRGYEYEPF